MKRASLGPVAIAQITAKAGDDMFTLTVAGSPDSLPKDKAQAASVAIAAKVAAKL